MFDDEARRGCDTNQLGLETLRTRDGILRTAQGKTQKSVDRLSRVVPVKDVISKLALAAFPEVKFFDPSETRLLYSRHSPGDANSIRITLTEIEHFKHSPEARSAVSARLELHSFHLPRVHLKHGKFSLR